MEIVDKPIHEPGVCYLCEGTNEGGYIDTLNNFDYGPQPYMNGRKYVCRPCVVEMAVMFGLAPPEQVASLKHDAAAAKQALAEAEAKLNAAQVIQDALELFTPPTAPAESITSIPSAPDTDSADEAAASDVAVVAVKQPAKRGRPKKVAKYE